MTVPDSHYDGLLSEWQKRVADELNSSHHSSGTFTGVTSETIPVPPGFTRYRLRVTGSMVFATASTTTIFARPNNEAGSTNIGTLQVTPSTTGNRAILDWTGFSTVRVAEWGAFGANTFEVTFSTPFSPVSTFWNVDGSGNRISTTAGVMSRQHVQGRIERAAAGPITFITVGRIDAGGGAADQLNNCRWWLDADGKA